MWSHTGIKRETYELITSSFQDQSDKSDDEPIDASSSSSSSSSEDESNDSADEDDQSNKDSSKQLVLYDPVANGSDAIEHISEPVHYQSPHRPFQPSRVLPSVGAFTVQCANCFKWRLIPTKEKYEEIREHILEQPFYCETAREWRSDVSCDDPADINQDGSRLWAIDKPNIAQPPAGWQRLLRIRGEGGTKFADVYYVAPSGKTLRSMVEIQKYLLQHPEYITDGVSMSQFSFQTPKPLQENYVRKRPRMTSSCDVNRSLEPGEVNPLAWIGPNDCTELELGRPALPPPCIDEVPAVCYPLVDRPAKRQQATTPAKEIVDSSNQKVNGVEAEGSGE
ncbi:hypothetical protein FNV43_RR20038 [Rhamnella rubrinervis]|uniref:Uncharacterized protein n=1 Tax=Rhamnella rubrinervis TaxID=2594499 RepID=A0A8K0DU41_9ROSA|nr:hypothetical protein FNV43_RR20038 [Rhamnella rubrinervis]